MHAPHHEGRARPLSLCLDLYTVRWRLSIPLFRKPIAWRRAHAMARRLRDPTTPSREASLARAQTAPDMVAWRMGRNPMRAHQFNRDGQSNTMPRRILTWHHSQHRSNTSTRANLSGPLHSARCPSEHQPQRSPIVKVAVGGVRVDALGESVEGRGCRGDRGGELSRWAKDLLRTAQPQLRSADEFIVAPQIGRPSRRHWVA